VTRYFVLASPSPGWTPQPRLLEVSASSPHPSPPKEEREIESRAGGSVKMRLG